MRRSIGDPEVRPRRILTRMRLRVIAIALLFAACKREAEKIERPEIDDSVRPVYPASIDPHPLAARLCDALHEIPAKRFAECKGATQRTLTSECTRVLSGALSFSAITLAEEDVAKCESEMREAVTSCDAVTTPTPPLPPACKDLIRGTLAARQPCRSTLECEDGLRCQGVGPTDVGVCLKPLPAGLPCGAGVDGAVAFARQIHLFEARPECEGRCDHNRCR